MTSTRPSPHIPSIIQFAVSGFGMLTLWGAALVYALVAASQFFQDNTAMEFGLSLLMAVDCVVLGLLVLPSTLVSFIRLINRPIKVKSGSSSRAVLFIILLWPLLLLLGSQMIKTGGWTMGLFPFVQAFSVLLVVFWLYTIAGRGLEKGSCQRKWGLLSSGMLGGTFLSIVFELAGGILLLIGFVVLVIMIPGLQDEVNKLATRISTVGSDIDALMRILTPYFTKPAVITTMLFSFSVAVPLEEEALKPIGMWFLSRKGLSPAQGFMAGVISGAGFGLVESMFNTASLLGDTWLTVTAMRFGTTLMHMLASGIVGWGLACAWTQRKFLRLAGAYLVAVLMHGIWNGLAIFLSISMIAPRQTPEIIAGLGKTALWGLGALTLLAFALLLLINARLRRSAVIVPEKTPS